MDIKFEVCKDLTTLNIIINNKKYGEVRDFHLPQGFYFDWLENKPDANLIRSIGREYVKQALRCQEEIEKIKAKRKAAKKG